MRLRTAIILAATACLAAVAVRKGPRFMQLYYHHGLKLVAVATGLDTPWSLVFLPDGRMLVGERTGHMRLIPRYSKGGRGVEVTGLPPVWATGAGGLLGIAIDPRFAENQLVYWSYSEPAPGGKPGASEAVARGRLVGTTLRDVQIILHDPEVTDTAAGFGSRLAFAPDGRLLVSFGDRDHRPDAQRLDSLHGKILRIEPDGGIPQDNPFVHTPGANPAIWAVGFRDPQGLAVDPETGWIWVADHGPQGGDEVDIVFAGHNYGWPVVSYGVDEGTGKKIGEGRQKAGIDPAAIWWGPQGVPPSGMIFLTSDRYPGWKGQLFMGTLWGQAMMRLRIEGMTAVQEQRLFTGNFERIRDVCQGPDGWLYVVANTPGGSIVRLER